MDKRLLEHYERELRFVRELGAEFARRFPKIAGRLGVSELTCEDPHVERLFQGYAFLSAGLSQRMESEFPGFTSNLLGAVYSQYLGPTPSMTVAQFVPGAQAATLSNGYIVPRGTVLRARTGQRGARGCEYRTAHAVELWPIEIDEVEYTSVLREIADVYVPTRKPLQGVLRIRLRSTGGRPFSQLQLDKLPFFLRGADAKSARLYEALLAHSASVVMRWGPSAAQHSARSSAARPVRALGFDDEHALLPCGPAGFRGYRLLQEYFAFPSRFQFVELSGLAAGFARCNRDWLDLLIPLTQHDESLQGFIETSRLLLFATPAINLFPRTCDRVPVLNPTQPFHIVVDRARPLEYEIHSVTRVAAHLQGSTREVELLPQRALRGRLEHDGERLHYSLERRPRTVKFEEQRLGERTAYAGSEVYLSLIEQQALATGVSRQLSIEAQCTNRDLPLLLHLGRGGSDFVLESGAPVEETRCVAGPSAPRSNLLNGDLAWRLVSQLSLNYLSLCEETGGAEALRELLALHAQLGDPQLRREPDGLRSVNTSQVIRPMPGPGPRQFVRGLEIQLQCEEQAFSSQSAFTFASVLSELFAKHATAHSFTETVLQTRERGEVYRWPTIAGLRHTL